MAEQIKFTQLSNVGDLTASAIIALSQAQGGDYASYSASLAQVAELVAQGVNYEDLPTTAKDILGAITELYNSGGGGGGSNVKMSDNEDGGVNLTVDGLLRVLAKQETIDGAVALKQNEEYMDIDIVAPQELEVYSTEETVVGRWINGKPIYKKTFDLGNKEFKASENDIIKFDNLNLEKLVKLEGTAYVPSPYDNMVQFPYYGTNAQNYVSVFGKSTGVQIRVGSDYASSNMPLTKVVITLMYTKTTDEVTL